MKSIYKLLIASVSLLALARPAAAQVRFAYDVNARLLFDNRENDGSGNMFSPSMTIFALRATPEIGLKAITGSPGNGYGFRGEATHRFMAGIDFTGDFGSGQSKSARFGEISLYYALEKQLSRHCRMEMYAGIFSRGKSRFDYGEAFLSDSLRFYDPNYEGLLLGFIRPRSRYEVGVDWMGQIGRGRRERFRIFSAGEADFVRVLHLGYAFSMYHYANSREVRGVVDNILLNPYLNVDFAPLLPLDKLSLRLGYLQSFQQDRVNVGRYVCPQGGEFVFELRKWNVSVRNMLYFGRDLMPLYDSYDAGGFKYGSELYFGDPYYRVRTDMQAVHTPAVFDRIDIFWEPRIATGLYMKIAARFNFSGRYSGSSQIVSIRFDLQELINNNK